MNYHQLMLENYTVFTKLVFEQLAACRLSVGQPKVLEYLWYCDGAIQRDIADACLIEPATATSLLTRMEKGGLVVRKNKTGDKRYSCVWLTDRGRETARLVVAAFAKMESVALAGLSQAEQERFIDFLARVNQNIMTYQQTTGYNRVDNQEGAESHE